MSVSVHNKRFSNSAFLSEKETSRNTPFGARQTSLVYSREPPQRDGPPPGPESGTKTTPYSSPVKEHPLRGTGCGAPDPLRPPRRIPPRPEASLARRESRRRRSPAGTRGSPTAAPSGVGGRRQNPGRDSEEDGGDLKRGIPSPKPFALRRGPTAPFPSV